MDKFGRNYVLSVEAQGGEIITVKLPFTIEFDVHRHDLSSANESTIKVYNLSPVNRNKLWKDQFDFGVIRSIVFNAGYGDNLTTVFKGNVDTSLSYRNGVDFITEFNSTDGGFAIVNSTTNNNYPEGTTVGSVIEGMIGNLQGFHVDPGIVGNFNDTLPRGNSYTGNTADLINEISGGGFFIDNGKANCLRKGLYRDANGDIKSPECIYSSDLFDINADSGIIGVPKMEQTKVMVDLLFEPSMYVGQKVKLTTVSNKRLDGEYCVISLTHRGMISEAVCGDAITTVGLLKGFYEGVK